MGGTQQGENVLLSPYSYEEDEYLQLSGLQHYAYCPRQWALITLENQWMENVRTVEGKQLGQFPLHNLEGIVTFGYTGASPALMGACAERGIALAFLTAHGRYIASVRGETCGNVLLRKAQYRLSDSQADCETYARGFLTGKLYNARWVLERTIRDHGQRVDCVRLKAASGAL